MSKIVAKSFYANGLPILARAYRTCKERLGEKTRIPVDELDLSTLTSEECCYLDIVDACERPSLRVELLTHQAKSRLNESAGRLLDAFNGKAPVNQNLKFSPEFELSTLVRHAAVILADAA